MILFGGYILCYLVDYTLINVFSLLINEINDFIYWLRSSWVGGFEFIRMKMKEG